jgi:hypothetical protein
MKNDYNAWIQYHWEANAKEQFGFTCQHVAITCLAPQIQSPIKLPGTSMVNRKKII